jgi:hypothetical protein
MDDKHGARMPNACSCRDGVHASIVCAVRSSAPGIESHVSLEEVSIAICWSREKCPDAAGPTRQFCKHGVEEVTRQLCQALALEFIRSRRARNNDSMVSVAVLMRWTRPLVNPGRKVAKRISNRAPVW